MGRWVLALLLLAVSAHSAQAQQGDDGQHGDDNMASPIDGVSSRFIESNGIRMRIFEAGDSGPLVLMAHGWPESWYNWRHQLTALAEAGYRAVAPDMRGYGGTDAPPNVDDYDIIDLTDDMVGILDALGEETAVMVGHDWGAIVAWHAVVRHPQRFNGLIAMSVPYGGTAGRSPMEGWRETWGENFYYILYHNEPGGVAEAEYDSDPRGFLSRLYLSPDSPRQAPLITDPHRSAGGWIGRLGAPMGLPDWLGQEDLDYIVGEFERAGFRGGINYYRNFHRNWEISLDYESDRVTVPTLFVAGSRDIVIGGATAEQLTALMSRATDDLRGVVLIPGIGHWVQQEAPEETNAAMLEFLGSLDL
ncbi:MAG: alpha/beta hydrolase [Gammaproteobacteria bacterium]|nr:alpha/beta hydrolase [Gammaproteobacteria bacterium]